MGTSTAVLSSKDHDSSRPVPSAATLVTALSSLVVSAEPAVVFSSVVRLCAPLICVAADALISEADKPRYAVAWPRPAAEFDHRSQTCNVTAIIGAETADHAGYEGALVLHFDEVPGEHEALLAQLIVERATAVIERERLIESVAIRSFRVENLELALTTNREIGIALGILMAGRKLTSDQAFDLLRRASQQSHRKLRELALEIAETGSIELPMDDDRVEPLATTAEAPRRISTARARARLISHCTA
jgi:hypothetical protein